MASLDFSDDETRLIDPSVPFKDIVVCCTSIPPEFRSEIALKVTDLGGVHKYDLTPDVTHLVVGEYDTPKYRHVARERPDIKVMDAAWVEAVLELWKNDDEIDFFRLEKDYRLKTFERHGAELGTQSVGSGARGSLLVCLTGFGEQRDDIADQIVSNGGRYTGDLTKKCSHLIVNKPEGKKFTAAKSWQIKTVTLSWLTQSIERGMILDEEKFDPQLPPEEQGVGAFVVKDRRKQSLGKRTASGQLNGTEERSRKLRKTASMKLNSQRDNLWGDILGRPTSREDSFAQDQQPQPKETTHEPNVKVEQPTQLITVREQQGIFGNSVFYIQGFDLKRTSVLAETITSLDGQIAPSLQDISDPTLVTGRLRFLIVPQTSQPDTHPQTTNDDIHVVTEFYVERCLHNRQFFPSDEFTLGRPFPLFPIPGFRDLTICSAAFTGIELSQVARAITQLGAKFEEQFRKATSVLIVRSLDVMRKEKLRLALSWGVPVVSADWLWECISTGYKVPLDAFYFPELQGRSNGQARPTAPTVRAAADVSDARMTEGTDSEPVPRAATQQESKAIDTSAFKTDSSIKAPTQNKSTRQLFQKESTTSTDFMTAPTFPALNPDPTLTELSSASLNKSPSPPKTTNQPPRSKSAPSHRKASTKPHPGDSNSKSASEESNPSHSSREDEDNAAAKRQQAAKALERDALTTKLTSLLDTSTHNPHTLQDHGARPRRRQILGRAVSNTSSTTENAVAPPLPATLRDDLDNGGSDEEREPPSTQIGYNDPEARERKNALLSRMMGGSGEKDVNLDTTPAGVTLSSSMGVATGRTLRRR